MNGCGQKENDGRQYSPLNMSQHTDQTLLPQLHQCSHKQSDNRMEYEDMLVKCLRSTDVGLHCIFNYDLNMEVRDYRYIEGRKKEKKKQKLSVRFEHQFQVNCSRHCATRAHRQRAENTATLYPQLRYAGLYMSVCQTLHRYRLNIFSMTQNHRYDIQLVASNCINKEKRN